MPPAFALSQDQTLRFIISIPAPRTSQPQEPEPTQQTDPNSHLIPSQTQTLSDPNPARLQSVRNASKKNTSRHPQNRNSSPAQSKPNPNPSTNQTHAHTLSRTNTNPKGRRQRIPSIAYTVVKERSESRPCLSHLRKARQPCLKDSRHPLAQTCNASGVAKSKQALPPTQGASSRPAPDLRQPLTKDRGTLSHHFAIPAEADDHGPPRCSRGSGCLLPRGWRE